MSMSKTASRETPPMRVLMIEDDRVSAEIIRAYLLHGAAKGISLEVSGSLGEGLEVLEGEGVDLVLLDLFLPDSRGYETFVTLRRTHGTLPLIVLTGVDDDSLAERAVRNGAQDYLVKSTLTPSLLARSIRYAYERGRSQAALRTREALYRLMADNATDLISRHSLDGRFLYASRAARNLLGWEPDELIGRNFFDMLNAEDRARAEPKIQGLVEGDRIEMFTFCLEPKDGSPTWLEVRCRAVRDESVGSKASEVLCISRDVTERHQAAARLEASESRYRAVVEDQTDLVCRFKPGGELTFVNSAFCRFFGHAPAELENTNLFDLLPEQDRVEVVTHLATLDQKCPIRSHEQFFEESNGEIRWLQWTDRAIFDRRGRIVELQSVGRETTEFKVLEEQLRHSQRMETVGRLVGGIAHDFNNILTAIAGYTDLLIMGLETEDQRSSRESKGLRKAVRRASSLTSRLLAFSRRQLVQREIVDLSQLVSDWENMLRQLISEQLDMEFVLCRDPLWVEVDRGQIEQVILNLVVNARDAIEGSGKIIVETRPVERNGRPCAELLVVDDGCGMDEALRPRIFEPFFTTKKGGRGTGLGLSTVDNILTELGGDIEVESTEGKGSTFRVLLPVSDEGEPGGRACEPEAAIQQGTESILLVEDDESVRSVIELALLRNAYRVTSTPSAEEALAVLAPGRFQLLLTDIGLPGCTGPDLALEVREVDPLLPVLFISGYTEDDDGFEEILSSRGFLLHKPFSSTRLLRTVREILSRREP